MTGKFFTQGQVITFVQKVFGPGRQSNGGKNISVVCPMCNAAKGGNYTKQKLAIRTDVFLVHCWVCSYKHKNLYNLISKYYPHHLSEYVSSFFDAEELKATEAQTAQIYKPVVLPKGFCLLADVFHRLSTFDSYDKWYFENAFRYLNERGINSTEDLWYWKLGATKSWEEGCKSRIIFPSFDAEGNISYWTGRSWKKSHKKYNNPFCNRKNIIFNEINIDWESPLTIVEGPFDLISCNQNATCMLGSELTLEYELLQKIVKNKTPIVLAFDPENKAQDKQMKVANCLLEFDVPVKIIEYKNKNKDVGDLTKSEFNDLLESAKIYSTNYHLRRKIASITHKQ